MVFIGPDSLSKFRTARGDRAIDVALLTHARNEADVLRAFPELDGATPNEVRAFVHSLPAPVWGEVVETPQINVGVLFLPMFADEMMTPGTRRRCRSYLRSKGLESLTGAGVRIACLGGLTASLTQYGRRIAEAAKAHAMTVTTGHAATGVSVYRTLLQASREFNVDLANERIAVVGLGSVGRAFSLLLLRRGPAPKELVVVDVRARADHVHQVVEELSAVAPGTQISVEFTGSDGALDEATTVYNAGAIVSAISSSNAIDIDRVSPGTILVDNSQPYCWSRARARLRIESHRDIVPCEAGLFDVSALGYRGHFPFDFADHGPEGSTTAWCCLTEGLLLAHDGSLTPTTGEPSAEQLERFHAAVLKHGVKTPVLQCGSYVLPVEELRAGFRTR